VIVVNLVWFQCLLSFVLGLLFELTFFKILELKADLALDLAHDVILSDDLFVAVLHHKVHDLLD
jgi:hypothetical protein